MDLTQTFAKRLLHWHGVDGRQGLPWQNNQDPYAVWVSEIMLQQTQVATVLERYPRFMKRFPTVKKLSGAHIDEVLAEWAGLGYYSRARNLHACAQQVMEQYSGVFPSDPLLLAGLKGIGRSTAGAIAAFAFQVRAPILDANVKRILARLFCIDGGLQDKAVNERLWSLANDLLPSKPQDMPVYTQALMDFGATWCTARKPVCLSSAQRCPFAKECQANLSNQVLQFPQKTIKAKPPEFDCDMLLLRHGDHVLLHKRPSKAIWGGLWSLPESAWVVKSMTTKISNLTLQDIFQRTLPDEQIGALLRLCQSPQLGESIKHIFTHRRLWIQIWHVQVKKAHTFASNDLKWVPLKKLGQYGLPQPIKLLLQGLSLARDDDSEN